MTDYHKSTSATFRPLDRAVASALLDFAAKRKNVGQSIELGGKTFTLEHISHSTSAFWRSRGLSIYFRTGRSVVRISDHWSASKGFDRSRKLNCGAIGSSRWLIANKTAEAVEFSGHGGSRFPYRMLAGICALKSFETRA